eukprot:7409496-Ditylum_brightwellii.AAC.1
MREHCSCIRSSLISIKIVYTITPSCYQNLYWGLSRRTRGTRLDVTRRKPGRFGQIKSGPTSYPAGMMVKWKEGNKARLSTVQESGTHEIVTGVESPSLSPCTGPYPAYISLYQNDIDANAMEPLISNEDLYKLWYKDQIILPEHLRLYLYWHQRLQHPSHVSMVELEER